jgi:uncharacterized protein YmfQ (DUF2313 family)
MSNGDLVPRPPQSPTQLSSPAFSPLPPPLPNDHHVRRGQAEYAWALSALLPQGIAWPRWPDSTLMKVVYGLAGIMGWVDGRAADLLERESDPRTTTEMLDSWERAWGLPDPCYTGPFSVAERRQLLVLKYTMLGAQSREFYYGVADFLGYSISITEYRPFMVGIDRCGDNRTIQADGSLSDWPCQIGSPIMRFEWTVHLQQPKLVWFRAGSGQAGIDPHLRIAKALDLECLLRRWAPAHTLPLFDYSGIEDPYAGTDAFFVVQRSGDYVGTRSAVQVVNTRPATVYWPQAPNAFYVASPTFDTPLLLQALAPPDPATTTWLNAVLSRGGSVSVARQQQVDLLIKRLKADGVWSSLDRLWLFAAEDVVGSLTDLVATGLATNVSGAAFFANAGYIGGPGFINTNFDIASAVGRKFTRNSASLGAWLTTKQYFRTQYNYVASSINVNANSYVAPFDGLLDPANSSLFAINDSRAANYSFVGATPYPYGMFAVNRSGATNSQAYYNGLEVQFSSNPSGPVPSGAATFCGGGGTAGVTSGAQLCMSFVGGSMTNAQFKAFYNHLRNYFLAIGLQVGTPPAP